MNGYPPPRWIGAGCAAGALALDLATKAWAISLAPKLVSGIEVLPVFNLVLVFNRGVSFGLLSSGNPFAPYLLVALGLLIVGFLGTWLWRTESRLEGVALGTVIGGAVANIVDRARDGAVTDFLGFHLGGYHWPAFNLADVAIVGGALLLVLASLPSESGRADSKGPRLEEPIEAGAAPTADEAGRTRGKQPDASRAQP